jgi:hypothetical protein
MNILNQLESVAFAAALDDFVGFAVLFENRV